MTNKEIEKRFLFDLEMGMFEITKTSYGAYIPHPIIYFDYPLNTTQDLKILKTILENIGFKNDNDDFIYDSTLNSISKSTVIGIMNDCKTYILDIKTIYTKCMFKISNILPDYIRGYKIK